MDMLRVLGLLQLLVGSVFTLTQPVHDHWGEFGPYGACSRTCGTGVAMRSRKCITSRTDGGHNCLGSAKSFRTCNTQECPMGSKDFREQQCSHFDRADFQGKPQSWVPYYGASNPCELNCVPRGQNFFYRHRPAVIDGTKCYVGRSDICVDGVCRTLTHAEFMGLDEDSNSVHSNSVHSNSVHSSSSSAVAVSPGIRDQRATAYYKVGVYGACSAACGGGLQHRSVECWVQDPDNPRVVEETFCINQRLQRPPSQQACNMVACAAEYSVSSFSVCSVTCGEGQQSREVFCVGSRGERLPEGSCGGLQRPVSVQPCRRPACHAHISWHVTEYGLCTRSCGGGVRERKVSCLDSDLHPYPETRCSSSVRPVSVESCNSQSCSEPQSVPSVQNPAGGMMTGYVPFDPRQSSGSASQQLYPPVIGPRCAQSPYGCCPDGHTPAAGPRNQGCSRDDCIRTRFGCCLDGVTAAQGFGRLGCPEFMAAVQAPSSPPPPFSRDACSLPRDDGPCDTWVVRFYFDSASNRCTEFWFGNCQGNANNFPSLAACQAECGGVVREPAASPRSGAPRRSPTRGPARARA